MNCPKCKGKTLVVDSRQGSNYIRRRRCCLECDYRFSTKEFRSSDVNSWRKLFKLLKEFDFEQIFSEED